MCEFHGAHVRETHQPTPLGPTRGVRVLRAKNLTLFRPGGMVVLQYFQDTRGAGMTVRLPHSRNGGGGKLSADII